MYSPSVTAQTFKKKKKKTPWRACAWMTQGYSFAMTTRVFDHQDWSAGFNCWVSRPGVQEDPGHSSRRGSISRVMLLL